MTIPRLTYIDTPGVMPRLETDTIPVRVDLDKLVASNLQLQCQPGGGKSWALRQLMEECFGRIPIICIDTEDEFHTLRERFDFVLAAPKGGDVAATPKTAAMLARKLIELRASAVISIFDLPMQERKHFVRLFCEALMSLPRSCWGPTLLPIDEIHVYAPERGHGESEALEPVADVGARGRKRGFCLIGATQRASKFHKDVAASLNNKIIGATTLDIDQKRAIGDLGFDTKDRQRLRMLKPGQFYAFGPAISQEVILVQSGQIQTTHPKPGQTVAAAAVPPSRKVTAMLESSLKDLEKEAEQEAKTLDELRAENAKLRRELGSAPSGRAQLAIAESERGALIERGKEIARREHAANEIKGMESVRSGLLALQQRIDDLSAHGLISILDRAIERARDVAVPPGFPFKEAAPLVKPTHARSSSRDIVREPASSDLTGVERKILETLRGFETLGVDRPDKVTVGALCGYSNLRSKSFSNACGSLRTSGLIEYSDDRLYLTPEGRQQAGRGFVVGSLDELHRKWFGVLDGVPEKILELLIGVYPRDCAMNVVARDAGYENQRSKSFANAKGRLKTLGLIEQSGDRLRATKILFPEGLR